MLRVAAPWEGFGVAIAQAGLLMVLIALLLWAAVGDIRHYIIPNRLNALIALLALPYWWVLAGGDWSALGTIALTQTIIAGIGFAVCAGLFAIGAFGGGDVKMLAALLLWVPAEQIGLVLVIMSLSGGLLAFTWWAKHRLIAKSEGAVELPYGVAIALGGLAFAGQPFLKTWFA